MSDYLQKIVYLTDSQYETLAGGGTVGSQTGLNDNYIYLTDGKIGLTDIDSSFILPVNCGGTGATSWASGKILVGNGSNTFTTIDKATANTANTLVQRDGSGNFSAGTITATLSGNATTATTATNLSAKPTLTASDNSITVTAGGKTSDAFTVPYATSAGGVAWSNVSGKPIEFITHTGALNTNGWKTLGGRSSGKKIAISYNNNAATWNCGTYSATLVYGCNDTKGMLDISYNTPTIAFGGSAANSGTDNDPSWYFKITGTTATSYNLNNITNGNARDNTKLPLSGGRLTGDTVLYTSGTGDTPALVFQREDTIGGSYYDWRILNTGGKLTFQDIGSHTSNAWTTRFEMYTDTLTGKFSGPLTGNVTGNISTTSGSPLTVDAGSTLYLNSASGTSIIFTKAGADTSHELARFNTDGHFVPKANSSYTIGTSSNQWSNVYSQTFTHTHKENASDGIKVLYSTTIDFFIGVGTGNESHGLYDRKASKWILYANAPNTWSFDGNATSATTASKLSNTSAIGSDVKPVYFTNSGIPQATATEMVRAFTNSNYTDLNTCYDSGLYSLPGGAVTNYPAGGAAYATILTVAYRKPSGNTKPDYAWQMGNFAQDSDKMWYRTSTPNTWRSWRQIVSIATNTGVGGSTTPVYVDANGSVQSCTSYANATVENANKVAAKLATTTKTYLLGTSTTITATAANVDLIGDTGIYATTTAGELSAVRHSFNVSGTEKAYITYNSTDNSLDFIFV